MSASSSANTAAQRIAAQKEANADHDAHQPVSVATSWRFGMVPVSVMHRPDLAPLSRYLFAILATYAGGDGAAFPTLATLATASGLSRSTVAEHLNKLEAAGVITRTRRLAPSGADRSTLITLLETAGGGSGSRTPVGSGSRTGEGPGAGPGESGSRTPVGSGSRTHNRRTEEQNAADPGATQAPPPPAHAALASVDTRICSACHVLHSHGESCETSARRHRDAPHAAARGLNAVRAAMRERAEA
jgi:DNA-binding transcriptional MocR family regulator